MMSIQFFLLSSIQLISYNIFSYTVHVAKDNIEGASRPIVKIEILEFGITRKNQEWAL
ncbi:hypothetical protein Patl1_20398 [Pistacia atlantica]|uniref:Uncharacterized protein n=2 Tax=Pistacia atlantica TaxID=434234 RepID=A0ACC1AS71_9ROSI|nr:hypothetical protein Patl1_13970 [Pistacia atlantica]KAJ0100509.1 hypothetical protein Patl1_20398 [Pistacia atlantica]